MNKLTKKMLREELPLLDALELTLLNEAVTAMNRDLESDQRTEQVADEIYADVCNATLVDRFTKAVAAGEHQRALAALEQLHDVIQDRISRTVPKIWAWLDPENDVAQNREGA